MRAIISGHNRRIMEVQNLEKNKKKCNCRQGIESSPLEGNCLKESVLYKAVVKSDCETKEYMGQTANNFKERF